MSGQGGDAGRGPAQGGEFAALLNSLVSDNESENSLLRMKHRAFVSQDPIGCEDISADALLDDLQHATIPFADRMDDIPIKEGIPMPVLEHRQPWHAIISLIVVVFSIYALYAHKITNAYVIHGNFLPLN